MMQSCKLSASPTETKNRFHCGRSSEWYLLLMKQQRVLCCCVFVYLRLNDAFEEIWLPKATFRLAIFFLKKCVLKIN